MKLSIVLAVRNEEDNLGRCLEAIKDIADEIIVFDEQSTDQTVEIAKKFGARIFVVAHEENFHITKQKAIDAASGDWILQLDADEVITPELAKEIRQVIAMSYDQIKLRQIPSLFKRHQRAVETRDGTIGRGSGEIVAFFIPRRNVFLGKALIHGGVYPDPAIRLIKKGKAYLPAKSVHEIMKIDGEVGWLVNDMLHYDSPTLQRYLIRMNRYTDLHATDLENNHVAKNNFQFINYSLIKPKLTFLKLYFRHAGFKDGIRGFLWSAFSAMHFPLAYYKYLTKQ